MFEFDFTYKQFKNIILTSDDNYFVAYGYDKLKDTIFVNHAETGEFLHKILVKYPNFKEVTMICGLPDKPWQVKRTADVFENVLPYTGSQGKTSLINREITQISNS